MSFLAAGSAPGETVALIVRTHALKTIAARQLTIEVIDVGSFDVQQRALVVITILVEPGNGIRERATVGWRVILRYGCSAKLGRGL